LGNRSFFAPVSHDAPSRSIGRNVPVEWRVPKPIKLRTRISSSYRDLRSPRIDRSQAQPFPTLLVGVIALILTACGGGSSHSQSLPISSISSVSAACTPSAASVLGTGGFSSGVTWSANLEPRYVLRGAKLVPPELDLTFIFRTTIRFAKCVRQVRSWSMPRPLDSLRAHQQGGSWRMTSQSLLRFILGKCA
jgi:hypothetical protein